jgi:hypothetical protein
MEREEAFDGQQKEEPINYPIYGSSIVFGDLHKSVEEMGDGRYIIYYSWGESA